MSDQSALFDEIKLWLSNLQSITLDHRDLRPLLAKLYLALVAQPDLNAELELLHEKELDEGMDSWVDAITAGSAVWAKSPADTRYYLSLFSLVRALDDLARKHPRSFIDDPENWKDVESGCYLIPRKRPRLHLDPRGQGMRRRLLKQHRVVPLSIGTRSVEVISLSQRLRSRATLPRKMGAAMFEGIELHPPIPSGAPFIITSISGKQLKEEIKAQVSRAVAEACFVMTWPELTVDVEHRAHIREELQLAASSQQQPMPQIVVAGSCHEEIEGTWYNRATIFDGYGQYEFSYSKFSPYVRHSDGSYENIGKGKSIPVFVTDDYVVGVAICKDLTDFNQTVPLGSLELDLLVVPSMGGPTTMDSHEAAAMELKAMNDTRVFVVQLDEKLKQAESLGWVLHASQKPVNARKAQTTPWVSYDSDIR